VDLVGDGVEAAFQDDGLVVGQLALVVAAQPVLVVADAFHLVVEPVELAAVVARGVQTLVQPGLALLQGPGSGAALSVAWASTIWAVAGAARPPEGEKFSSTGSPPIKSPYPAFKASPGRA
jgi:hypothetical protein